MAVQEVRVSGLDCLRLGTRLLQRVRLADHDAGLWEAADLQWWWRTPRRSDTCDQVFWIDDDGPVAAVILTEWDRRWQCDPVVVPGATSISLENVWVYALDILASSPIESVEVIARDDETDLLRLLTDSGFAHCGDPGGITWLAAGHRPAISSLPAGLKLVDRSRPTRREHPMRLRSGASVEKRLRECSLYNPELDLAIEGDAGSVAGYSLYWFDPTTHVGLVEPMRVEHEYQRHGLARAMLSEGLERLARRGAERVKVGFSNDAARDLYLGADFALTATWKTYLRS